MIGYIILSFYIIGVVLCFRLSWKINKHEHKKRSPEEKTLDLCLCLFSWIGYLAIVAGHLAGYNQLHLDDDEDI